MTYDHVFRFFSSLTEPLSLIREPCSAFLNYAELYGDINYFSLSADAFPVYEIEFRLFKRGSDFFFNNPYSCLLYTSGKDFYNIALYEDLLRQGKRPFPIAGDDNHNIPLFDTSTDLDFCDSFGAFTYIAAPDLSYESVVAAMEKGDLYASAGPKIKSLYYEDGNYYIETSPVREIFLRAGNRHSFRVASSDGKPITSAVLEGFENDIYVRFSAIDFEGNAADTRAVSYTHLPPPSFLLSGNCAIKIKNV